MKKDHHRPVPAGIGVHETSRRRSSELLAASAERHYMTTSSISRVRGHGVDRNWSQAAGILMPDLRSPGGAEALFS